MKNQFIGKDRIFTREQLREIRGGNEDWDTYYEGFECGRDGRTCNTDSDCLGLACNACTPYLTGGMWYGETSTYVKKCT